MIERESLGVEKVDAMIEGGLPNGSVVGLFGSPGVGKSIFSLHFLLEGARNGQKCVYINLEEPRKNIERMIKEFDFGHEFFELEKKGLIVIRCFDYPEYEKIYLELLQKIGEDKSIKRLVIDSFNCFFSSIDSRGVSPIEINVRKIINSAFCQLRNNNLTALLILEKDSNSEFQYNIPYLVDGIISLDFLDLGIIERRISVPKMRWTNQYKEGINYEINKQGIVVLS